MKIIGLCGGSGSGKGAVCDLFLEFGVPSIDTDALYHKMTSSDSPCLRALAAEFGESIIDASGGLDRSVLREIVFSSSDGSAKLKKLNEIAHTYILARTREIIKEYEAARKSAVIVDAPLLFESGFDKECDFILCVIADEKIRVNRIVLRDGISEENAYKRIRSQINTDELISKSDAFITNNGDYESLSLEVKRVSEKIFGEDN